MKLFKQIIIVSSCFFIALVTYGQQNDYYREGDNFNSVFQHLETGTFQGSSNGLLLVRKNDSPNKSLIDFQGSPAALIIEYDEHQIYDLSTKIYKGQSTSGKTTITYSTYGGANALQITLNKKSYKLSLIDGACIYVIGGLNYHYEAEENTEYLLLTFTKTVTLQATTGTDSIHILPHSSLIFAMARK